MVRRELKDYPLTEEYKRLRLVTINERYHFNVEPVLAYHTRYMLKLLVAKEARRVRRHLEPDIVVDGPEPFDWVDIIRFFA